MASARSATVQKIEQLSEPETSSSEVDVGSRLRAARELFGLSQRKLANLSGLTNGTISMIEQNQTSPSVASLKKLTDAMSLTLAEFFALDWSGPAGFFFQGDDLADIGSGAVSLRLVPAGVPDAKLQLLHERYAVGGDTGPEMLSHEGEEAGVVVRGSVRVTVGGQERVLGPGDAYYFSSRLPHRFSNVGDEVCEIVSAATPLSL